MGNPYTVMVRKSKFEYVALCLELNVAAIRLRRSQWHEKYFFN